VAADAEASAMKTYFPGTSGTDLLSKGNVIAFGRVMDPKGPWGVGIVSVRDQAELCELQGNDPAMRAQIGLTYEAYEMPRLVHAGK
jgi:hypothetical protein